MSEVIAFVAYEEPWFPCGGIAAVMGRLPGAIRSVCNLPILVITPFHSSTHQNNKIHSLSMTPLSNNVSVDYAYSDVSVSVFRYGGKEVPWYFLKVDEAPPEEERFFTGIRHPYDLPSSLLVRDSIFFGAAVVQALSVIAQDILQKGEEADWQLFLQDWEAATTALAFTKQSVYQGSSYLTLHNSYDEYATPTDDIRDHRDYTILGHALSLVRSPVLTVSEEFARELTEDLLERVVMASHLQTALQDKGIFGIDNGPFKNLAVPRDLLDQADAGVFAPLQQWKSGQRAKALEELSKLPDNIRCWGKPAEFREGDSPWLVMAGRDDPRQKGYDVAAAAVESYLLKSCDKADRAQFLFFPILGDEDEPGLAFLQGLADRFPKDVLVFLGRWEAGYSAALRGASYGLMPSLYEPFGMANEFYLDGGCVGIGRATGGNLEQIVPLRAASAFSSAVKVRANRYHAFSARPTGILFRESDAIASVVTDWRGINSAEYDKQGGSPTRVEQRQQYPVFRAMVEELRLAIEDGIRVYTEEPELYYRMLSEGVAHIQQTFSWQRAAQEYVRQVE